MGYFGIMGKAKKSSLLFLVILVGLNILGWLAVYDLSHQDFEVIFFDVGQGDSTLIKTPQGHHILIDGGPNSSVLEKLGKEMPFWERTVDLIILTHPEQDHLSGLIEVLRRYRVENILWTGVLKETAVFEEWQRLIKEEKANIYIAKAGELVLAGQTFLEIIHPFESFENQKVQNVNNTSIAFRAVFGENSFLFTGDAFKEVERELVNSGVNLRSNVLQVGHHGSRTSTAPEFVAAVFPEVAVISAGKDNKFGHPNLEVLETLANYGILIFRTDQEGDIKIISNGKTYAISLIQN